MEYLLNGIARIAMKMLGDHSIALDVSMRETMAKYDNKRDVLGSNYQRRLDLIVDHYFKQKHGDQSLTWQCPDCSHTMKTAVYCTNCLELRPLPKNG